MLLVALERFLEAKIVRVIVKFEDYDFGHVAVIVA